MNIFIFYNILSFYGLTSANTQFAFIVYNMLFENFEWSEIATYKNSYILHPQFIEDFTM